MTASYIIASPVRNEAATIRTTLEAVIGQSAKPAAWLILDDGSSDGTAEIVEEYSRTHSWIRLTRLADRGHDLVGCGVAAILNHALELVRDVPADYLCKLDGDLDLPPGYFERLLDEMEKRPRLGILSGQPYVIREGQKMHERHSDYFPAGPARMYRRAFLEKIGEFPPSVGWDTVDILRMRIRGYETTILRDLEFHHMRRMGTRQGYIDGMVRDGVNAHLTGYSALFFLSRAVFNMRYSPYLLRTACMVWGFLRAKAAGRVRIVDEDELRFHQAFQFRRLLLKRG